ncbi:UDP-N-acetylmuramate:L-alanyl-gamma-D-glutamyl-meso-diaminopimelate ligase [candidate division KSB1 bacterium]|nr:UDP-N-acetylmuramate:L-alanyl-gamma-D-glutamyl-meso-diaminopimelate ligase [candidate division KSB1 bacterium]
MIKTNKQPKRIYFMAICGTAMASLAAMLKESGYKVYGSDSDVYPPMSTFLSEHNIDVFEGFSQKNLQPAPDLVVVGNVISRGNEEIEYVLDHHIPYISLSDALREYFIRGRRSLVVTGTHGKTTTSSLLAWIFQRAGRNPGFLIGGIPKNFDRGYQVGGDEYFIVEGDEYDSAYFDKVAKFLRYIPDIGIINHLEFDHADIYNSLDEIKLAFKRFVNLIPRNGLLAICSDFQNVVEISQKAFCPVLTFAIKDQHAVWKAEDITIGVKGMRFDVLYKGDFWGRVKTTLSGEHNVRNILAAIAVSHHEGIKRNEILRALSCFAGIKRRLEFKGLVKSAELYDDFGHHPTAIRETLSGFRKKYSSRRIWALFEPRSATMRRNIFQRELAEALQVADVILLAPIHRPDKAPAGQILSIEKLVQDLNSEHRTVQNFQSIDEIVQYVKRHIEENDVLITFSNGGFGGIHEKLIDLDKQ